MKFKKKCTHGILISLGVDPGDKENPGVSSGYLWDLENLSLKYKCGTPGNTPGIPHVYPGYTYEK
jgi:hypothetical protein